MPPLSAEPLVGLKRPSRQKSLLPNQPFSRTPRGFEAVTDTAPDRYNGPFSRTPRGFEAGSGNSTRTTSPLSAEPLVGLKRVREIRPGRLRLFQPNPSWV